MQVCQKLASLTGYKFPRLRREGTRGNQVWIYGVAAPDFQKDDEGNLVFVDGRAVPVSDRREEVFTAWVERDILAREKAAKAKLEAQVQATIPNCQLSALAETEINTLTTLQEQYAEQKTQTLTEEVESIVITHDSESQVIIAELPVENHQQSTEAVIEKLLKISNWGEVAANQAEIDQVWPLLSENQRSHLWQLHQKYQQQLSLEELAQQAIATQAEIKETGFGSHFRSYVLKAVRGGIAIARKCWGDKQECSIPLNQLLLATG